ncbi:MFS transporter [Sulfidibacter corallicola]|uniref:MFS transporter n=1 Tax=Sulfidibacter corallicola TaxID=2818388 RepID=A0A8A4TIF8_SULCO|nr:MFS transporter [Sulfidibacter corallicola]QTD49277.1 MFS transporter [Sulfidibacter corallicola]
MAASFFFFFLLFGLLLPYLSPVLLDLGFSKSQTGLILSGFYFFNAIMPLLGGRLSDRFLSVDRLLRLDALVLMALTPILWVFSDEAGLLFLLPLFLFGAAQAPVISLQDTLAMQVSGGDPKRYGHRRLVGSLGFIVSSIGMGYLVDRFGLRIFFPALVVAALLFWLNSFFLPREIKPRQTRRQSPFWRELTGSWWLWLLAMMLHWLSFSPYHYGFTLLLIDSGISAEATGWYWSLGVLAEIGVFLASGWFFKRWHYRTLLLAAFAANLIRWLVIGLYPVAWVLGASQLLHGLGFGLFYAAAMQAISRFSQQGNRASYQGLFSTCVGGVSAIVGSGLSGWLHEQMPIREVFLWILPLQAAGLVLLWLNPLKRQDPASELPQTLQAERGRP